MTEAGYTLAETLAALAVIGLAIGGFSAGMQVIGGMQLALGGRVAETEDARAAQARIQRLLDAGGEAKFAGEGREFRFGCGAPQPCSASLAEAPSRLEVADGRGGVATYRLRGEGTSRFAYLSRDGEATTWPPAGGGSPLRSVVLLRTRNGSEAPVLVARAWAEQPGGCAYDPIGQGCG